MTLADELTALRKVATPGVWDCYRPHASFTEYHVCSEDRETLAVTPGDEGPANAALIVALVNNLPEIVAALEAASQ